MYLISLTKENFLLQSGWTMRGEIAITIHLSFKLSELGQFAELNFVSQCVCLFAIYFFCFFFFCFLTFLFVTVGQHFRSRSALLFLLSPHHQTFAVFSFHFFSLLRTISAVTFYNCPWHWQTVSDKIIAMEILSVHLWNYLWELQL